MRTIASANGRKDIADYCIGELLSISTENKDGSWPSEHVCVALEQYTSERMIEGVRIGKYNSRGASFRGPGGEQERDLAKVYRSHEAKLGKKYPFVGRLLENIAKGYDRDAEWHDTDAEISKRLR